MSGLCDCDLKRSRLRGEVGGLATEESRVSATNNGTLRNEDQRLPRQNAVLTFRVLAGVSP